MRFLLDTDICVFVIRQKPLHVLQRFEQHKPDELGISTISVAELRYGAAKSSEPTKNHAALDAFLAPLEIAPFDEVASDCYGSVRADLETRGVSIGPLDTMIAAHALGLQVPLVTNNERDSVVSRV